MSTRYLDLADYVAIAAEVTGLSVETIVALPRLSLAESALHAPSAGFGDYDLYPDFIEKAAVLLARLARNHPLPDATSALPGLRCACSWRSTAGRGSPRHP